MLPRSAGTRFNRVVRPGKKSLTEKFQLPDGKVGEAALRREIRSQNIAGTIRVALADIADGACKSERQMRDILHGYVKVHTGTISGCDEGYNFATIDGHSREISYNKPVKDWTNQDIPWTIQSSLDAGGKNYDSAVGQIRSAARLSR